MAINFNEETNSNEYIQSDHNLQILIKQIDEIKDTIKDNDKIEWVFTETTEWQFITKSLNLWLKESLNQNPVFCQKLIDYINILLDDPNLQLNDDIKNSLASLSDLLNWVLADYDFIVTAPEVIVAPGNEALEDSPVSIDFLDSLSVDDLKSLIDEKGSIKKDLIKEENWKEYIIINWERFNVGKDWADYIYEKNNNTIIAGLWYITLWSKNSYLYFRTKYNDITIYNDKTNVTKFSDWQSMRTYENENGFFRSSNGIDVRTERGTWVYRFYSNNNSILTLGMNVAHEFPKITSILSKIKDSKEQCKIVDENTLQVWDTTYEFLADVNDIAEWINNYYN